MSILRQLTTAEADQIWLDSLILRKAEAMHHFAAVSSSVSAEFWGMETNRLIDLLNADIPRSLSIMENDFAVNVPVNSALDMINLPQFACRAPIEAGRTDIVFNGTAFVYSAPLEPEEELEAEAETEPES